ncbi:MAG: ricin-type beta-trefoil lectin domain protein [Nocardioides sp.]
MTSWRGFGLPADWSRLRGFLVAAAVLSLITVLTRAEINLSAASEAKRGPSTTKVGVPTSSTDPEVAQPLSAHGLCLTPSRKIGHPVLRSCRGREKQMWFVRGATIENAKGRCLTAPVKRFRYVFRGDCRPNRPGQSWTFDGPAVKSADGACLTIIPERENTKPSMWRRSGVKMRPCSGMKEQQWTWGAGDPTPDPSPSGEPTPTASPTPTTSPSPTASPSPSPSGDPSPSPSPTDPPPSGGSGPFDLLWQSDFSEGLSRDDWNIYNTGRRKTSRCFWAGNTSVSGGVLQLRGNPATSGTCASNYTASGGLDTGDNHLVSGGGRWEVRAKVAGGVDSSGKPISYGYDSYLGVFPLASDWSYEIDFIENITREPRSMHLTQHWRQGAGRTSIKPVHQGDWSGEFHTYALEVFPAKGSTPGTVKYYIDGKLAGTQELMFELKDAKLAMGYIDGECDRWIGCPANAAGKGFGPYPADDAFEIDWVKIYKYTG